MVLEIKVVLGRSITIIEIEVKEIYQNVDKENKCKIEKNIEDNLKTHQRGMQCLMGRTWKREDGGQWLMEKAHTEEEEESNKQQLQIFRK